MAEKINLWKIKCGIRFAEITFIGNEHNSSVYNETEQEKVWSKIAVLAIWILVSDSKHP